MTPTGEATSSRARRRPARMPLRRAPAAASWDERCAALFEDLKKPARVLIARAFGGALSPEEIEDVYANAWTATLSALKGRAERMSDDDLRSYLLTAVAGHAGKEMRRRRRKPTTALEDSHAQILSDSHQPTPEERAVGEESGSVARDVLVSLPPRRRAVILLRYGWGLEPKEVCSLVANLSPRAYRKEITRGIEQMIERLGQAESGEWCRSREPMLRDLVAGTADEEVARQARGHLDHCRSCAQLVGRLQGQLQDLGSGIAWSAAAGALDDGRLSLGDRLAALLDRGGDGARLLAGRGEGATDAATGVAGAGGTRGAGAAGAGALAKLAGLGMAGKAAVACIGAGVAATACVAAGLVPGPTADRERPQRPPERPGGRAVRALTPAPTIDSIPTETAKPPPAKPGGGGGGEAGGGSAKPDRVEVASPATAVEGAPLASPAPAAPPEQQEFGLPAAASSGSPGSGGSSGGSGGGSGSGSGASGSEVAREFGP